MESLKFSWLEWLPWRSWRLVGTVEAADEVPMTLPPKGAVLVGTSTYPKWLAFDCPCRQNHRIMVTLDVHHKPHWDLLPGKRLTLSPSVDAWRGGKRCHYVIRNGRTLWVRHEER